MIDWLFIMLLVIAVLFVLLAVERDWGIFWNTIFIMGSIILFFTLGASVMDIESPYTMYNATSGNIEEGFHTTQSTVSPYLSYFFMFLGIIMVIYFVGYVFGPAIYKKWMR